MSDSTGNAGADEWKPQQVAEGWFSDCLAQDRDAKVECLAEAIVRRIKDGLLAARTVVQDAPFDVLSIQTMSLAGRFNGHSRSDILGHYSRRNEAAKSALPAPVETYYLIHRDTIRQHAGELVAAWAAQIGPMGERLRRWARIAEEPTVAPALGEVAQADPPTQPMSRGEIQAAIGERFCNAQGKDVNWPHVWDEIGKRRPTCKVGKHNEYDLGQVKAFIDARGWKPVSGGMKTGLPQASDIPTSVFDLPRTAGRKASSR